VKDPVEGDSCHQWTRSLARPPVPIGDPVVGHHPGSLRQRPELRAFVQSLEVTECKSRKVAINVDERSGQLRPYVRPFARRPPRAIMGVRLRVRHQSVWRARGTRHLTVLPELLVLTTAFPITLFSASCRISRAYALRLPSCGKPSGSSLRCGHDTTLGTVDLFARHHRPGDARHLVRERHGHQPDRATLQNFPEPGADCAVPSVRPMDH
jgi:hypothetical protein